MTINQEFKDFLQQLMEASPEIAENVSEPLQEYIQTLLSGTDDKPVLTDNGKLILEYLQNNPKPTYKAKEIGEGLDIPSRKISGSMRKLVSDGFVDKIGKDPTIYVLTDKGKSFIID